MTTSSDLQKEIATLNVCMRGWMCKQSESLMKSWRRRYFMLHSNILSYYSSEVNNDNDNNAILTDIFRIVDVFPLVSVTNGLLLQLANGKSLKLRADTSVLYKQWLEAFASVTTKKNVSSDAIDIHKAGFVNVYENDDSSNTSLEWKAYYVVVHNDTFSAYDSDDNNSKMELSGIMRAIQPLEQDEVFGLIVRLNKARKIKICFKSEEELTSWKLTLEFALMAASTSSSRENTVVNTRTTTTSSSAEDNGIWI